LALILLRHAKQRRKICNREDIMRAMPVCDGEPLRTLKLRRACRHEGHNFVGSQRAVVVEIRG
tara:strand:- start:471 stop:659 length:189 start_codon:yes stop_codon:yes gene_type:complete